MLFNICKKDLNQKIGEVKWIKDSYENMLCLCDNLLEVNRPYPIAYEGTVGSAARAYGAKISMLATAGIVSDETYIRKAIDMLMYLVETGDLEFFEKLNGHLAVADAAFTYAICYDLLESYLKDTEKEALLATMKELATYLYECDTTWRLPHSGVTSCNHNAVHHGALGLCALIFNNDAWLEFSVERIRGFFEYFADETGYVTEGVSYAFYGLTNALVFSEAYYLNNGIDLVGEYSKLKEIPNQFIEHMLPRYDFLLSLNDHYRYIGNSGALMYLISRFGSCQGLYLWKEFEDNNESYGSGSECGFRNGIVFPFLIHWANPKLPMVMPSSVNRPLSKKFDSGRVMMRTAWDDDKAVFVSFTSGKDAHRGHNHPDQNSFTAYALGEDFLIDPGTIGRDSRSHNIVLVNSEGQQFGTSKGEIKFYKDYDRYVKVIGDATEAYVWAKNTLIGYAVRHLTFIRKPYPLIIIRDDIQSEIDGENFFEFMLHTAPENEFYQKNQSLFIKGNRFGNLCKVEMINPKDIEIGISNHVERNIDHYKKNHDLSKWHKEAVISTKAVNPFFTSVISFGESEEDMPHIESSHDGKITHIKIRFKDGYCEEVDVEGFDTHIRTGMKK